MASERYPNDPYRADDPTRPGLDADAPYRRNRLENDLQADPELADGPANSRKIALVAVVVAVLLGAVFYGLNNSSLHQNGTSTAQKSAPATAQNTASPPPPSAPQGTGDATQPGNTATGVTTGSVPSQMPPKPAPAAPDNNAPASK